MPRKARVSKTRNQPERAVFKPVIKPIIKKGTNLSRQYPERPIVGVGVVLWRQDRILLVRRRKPPRRGQWSLPGGAQRLGETVEETARREVLEETGLTIEILGLVDVFDSIHKDPKGDVEYHYTLVDFCAVWVAGEPAAASDAAEATWFSFDRIRALGLWPETLRVIDLSRKLLGST